MSSSGVQLFARPIRQPQFSLFGRTRADDFGLLGRLAMPHELLVAPGNGRLSGNVYYAVASGKITIPLLSVNSTVNFVLNQNYFSNPYSGSSSIIIQSDVMATRISSQSLSPGSTNWFVVCKLSGNSVGNGILISDFTIAIGSSLITGRFYSNKNPFIEPIIQLSLGVQFSGTTIGSSVFTAMMSQFELQQP